MTQLNPLTESQIKALEDFQKLSDKERCDILTVISSFEQMRANGHSPSPNNIFEQLSAIGHL